MKRFCVVAVLIGVAFSSFAFSKTPVSGISKSLVFPVAGKKSIIGSFWGAVRDGGKRKHEGIDIFARKGTAVVAICDGYIVSRGNTPRGGKTLWLQSATHPMTAYYAHLDQQKVRNGQYVRKGQVIGTVGNTGNAKFTPPHLHFGIYTFRGPVNPLPYVKNSPKIQPQLAKKPQPVMAKNGKTKIPAPNVTTTKVAALDAHQVVKKIMLPSDPSAKYYMTTKSDVVRLYQGKLQLVGKWMKGSTPKFPYKITLINKTPIYVNRSGKIITANGIQIGTIS